MESINRNITEIIKRGWKTSLDPFVHSEEQNIQKLARILINERPSPSLMDWDKLVKGIKALPSPKLAQHDKIEALFLSFIGGGAPTGDTPILSKREVAPTGLN